MHLNTGFRSTTFIKITAAAFLLSLPSLLVLFGCSSHDVESGVGDASTSASGSVTEYDVALPDSIEEIAALSCSRDGETVYALTGGYFNNSTGVIDGTQTLLWATDDQGATWKPLHDVPAGVDGLGVVSGAVNADGDCFIAALSKEAPAETNESSMPKMDFFYIGQEGDPLKIDYDFGLIDGVNISFVSDDRVLVGDYSNSFLIDTVSGRIVEKYETAASLGMAIAASPVSDGVFVIAGYGDAKCFVGQTGEPCDMPAGLKSMFEEVYADHPQSIVLFNSERGLYCADAKAIYKFSPQSDQYEKMISFTELMLGGGEPYLTGFAVDGKNKSYLSFYSPTLMTAAFKSYSLNKSSTDSVSVSVYTLESNSALNSAILKFQESNPGVQWSVEVGLDGQNATTIEDAIRKLNARLLAGEGPDVILLDGLPISSYIDKQVLADLSEVVGSDVDIQEDYFSNVLKTYSQDGKIYAMPTSFYFYGGQGSSAFIERGSEVAELSKELVREAETGLFGGYKNQYGGDVNSFNKFRATAKALYGLYSPYFVTNGRVDSENLESFYSSCKALQNAMGETVAKGVIDDEADSILYQALDSISGSDQSGIGLVAGAIDLSALLQQQRDAHIAWSSIPTSAACFVPYMSLGINENSIHKSEAQELIRYMLKSEYQDTLVMSFPVERNSFRAVMRDAHPDKHESAEDDELLFEMILGDEQSVYVYKTENESEIEQCVDLVGALSVPTNDDAVVRESVLEGLESYLGDSKTLSQVVSETVNRINLYLAE